ncbi:unnamed protein product [Nippostrongylus brasiliensis]|uniref:HAUS augmin-like complex subunit 4 n=1 Tax=Nippostrongylus brasiliensis TaxID=27835 RepID=A0A0N4XCU4_NIPBR|nr:unnamed protein product [Nippostrongylus brasiliensis]
MEDAQTAIRPVPAERKHQIRMSNGHQQNGLPNGTAADQDLTTTTLSTIAVRAGDQASIVVALLKSVGYLELRVDEMRPGLLQIGETSSEVMNLLDIHDDLLRRLKDKEDQVTALLIRTENLSSEKEPKEAIVYGDMAVCLREAWRGLQKQLMLRGYLLKETLTFFRLAERHQKLVEQTSQALKLTENGGIGGGASRLSGKADSLINELIDTTVQAMDVGSSVISQIRALGPISDNPERDQEMLNSCVLIEHNMLRIAAEWERVEALWKQERSKVAVRSTADELLIIEQWLTHAERRVKAVNETGFRMLLNEGNVSSGRRP